MVLWYQGNSCLCGGWNDRRWFCATKGNHVCMADRTLECGFVEPKQSCWYCKTNVRGWFGLFNNEETHSFVNQCSQGSWDLPTPIMGKPINVQFVKESRMKNKLRCRSFYNVRHWHLWTFHTRWKGWGAIHFGRHLLWYLHDRYEVQADAFVVRHDGKEVNMNLIRFPMVET